MQYTSNYNLAKPDADDIINPTSRSGYNDNFDTLDATLKSVSNKANANESDITDIQDDISDLDAKTGDDIPFESGSTDSISDKITILSNSVGNLSNLLTTAKDSIVNAINELFGRDYIVEQGTSGIWTYRKWNSGIMEEWGIINLKGIWSSWGSIYYLNPSKVEYAIPFVSIPIVNAFATATLGISSSSILCAGSYNACTEAEKKSFCSIALYRGTTGTNDVDYPVSVMARGRWK